MLRPHEMSSVIITGPKNVQENIIRELYNLRILHIVEHSKSELADIGTPLESASKLSELLVRIRALKSALGIGNEKAEFELKKGMLDMESHARKINDELNSITDELRKMDAQAARNEALLQELEMLSGIRLPLEYFSSYKSLAYFTGYMKAEPSEFEKDVAKVTKKYMLLSSSAKNKNFIALFVDAKSKDEIARILQKSSFSPVILQNVIGLKGIAAENLKKIGDDASKLQSSREQVKRRIERMSQEHRSFLISADNFLGEQLEKAEAPLKFAATPSSFLIKGWVPTQNLQDSIGQLNKAGSDKVYIHSEPAKKSDRIPIKQKNPKPIRPFEFFLDLYSMPTYREIDPTFFLFLTFPIFFGIMLGDIGYGIVSLAVFWLLRRKMPSAKRFFNILMLAASVSILFGLIFGEFFGVEIFHSLVSREHEMFKLLYIVLGIGVVHVNIGLIVGFINVYKNHGLVMAIYEKASWIVLELGVVMLALSLMGLIAIPWWAGAVFLAASVLMLFKGEGVKGIMELPSIFTNILSYARLMAIGLSSVILAVIINDSAKEFFHMGGFFVILGVLILIVGHVINIMLGLLGSFLHSLRLHYVEFFSKFFTGGGKKYEPFGLRDED